MVKSNIDEMAKTAKATGTVHKGPSWSSSLAIKKRPRPEVQVVTCGAAFPISTKPRRPPAPSRSSDESSKYASSSKRNQKNGKMMQFDDWHDTVKQVRSLGSTGFTGQQKRDYQEDQYKRLTGREQKKQSVPLPIVRGLRKKAAARAARQVQEAKDAGIVLASTSNSSNSAKDQQKKKKDSTNRVHGPAPSIGFVKKGVFRVQKTKQSR